MSLKQIIQRVLYGESESVTKRKFKKPRLTARQKAIRAKQLRRLRMVTKQIKRIKTHFVGLRSLYVIGALVVLLVTTLVWSILGAHLQASNADQLIDGALFQNSATFHGALLPNAHSFLIKWPLFVLLALCGNSERCLVVLTVIVSLITVFGLAYLLYRINPRPRVFGTLILVLSCVLLLIPAQPHSGALLPSSFAMLTTRNIEYVVYVFALALIVKIIRFKSRLFIFPVVLLTLLFASDKLFMSLSVGGAVILSLLYLVVRQKELTMLAIRWLVASVVAAIIATGLLWSINVAGITHIIGDSGSPYAFIHSSKQAAQGFIFGFLGILTNLGANPLYDIGIVKDMPKLLLQRLLSPVLIPYVINVGVLIVGLIAAVRVYMMSTVSTNKPARRTKKRPLPYSQAVVLSIMLLASTIVAIGSFVLTNHYYPVDARYMTICLFAIFTSLATYLRVYPLPGCLTSRWAVAIILFGIVIGCFWSIATTRQQSDALNGVNVRNKTIISILENHKTDLLVGDYWRVIPIGTKDSDKSDSILPLASCTDVRQNLRSTAWQSDLVHHSFTYLLSLDKSATDFPQCSISQVVAFYGHPNASTLVAGTIEHPQELLLFYDGGMTKGRAQPKGGPFATILPNTPVQAKLTPPVCTDNQTVMNIVAHQDDDLLFMNPDLSHEIQAGECIRTVYVTAGDAGANSQYWLGREQGTQVAYGMMLGLPPTTIWIQRVVKIDDNRYVTIANPRSNKKISLIFMRLPDGNINGAGFRSSSYESLAKLHAGHEATITSIDSQSTYSSAQLIDAFRLLMTTYQPTTIHTQASKDYGTVYHDHSDHISVGRYVEDAVSGYSLAQSQSQPIPLSYYIGYPIREKPINLTIEQASYKTTVFLAYGETDGSVCHTVLECDKTPTYNAYLNREYTVN